MADNNWKSYNLAQLSQPARPRLLRTLDQFTSHLNSRYSLDLGCGSGRDSLELCRRGWRVDAIDSNTDSLELFRQLINVEIQLNKPNIIFNKFEDLVLQKNTYDLINASYSLPFCHPDFFDQFWLHICQSLKNNSIFTFELFGDKDSWNTQQFNQKMTFLNASEISNLLSPFQILELNEIEKEGPSFSEPIKNWHYFEITLRKITN